MLSTKTSHQHNEKWKDMANLEKRLLSKGEFNNYSSGRRFHSRQKVQKMNVTSQVQREKDGKTFEILSGTISRIMRKSTRAPKIEKKRK